MQVTGSLNLFLLLLLETNGKTLLLEIIFISLVLQLQKFCEP